MPSIRFTRPEPKSRLNSPWRLCAGYETEEEQYAAYDGMFAHYLLSMERVDRAYTWTTPEELRNCVADAYAPD